MKDNIQKKKELISLAKKYNWRLDSEDKNNGRISFKDELSIYRMDIYLSKMTVGLLPIGDKPIWFKRRNMKMIEEMLSQPSKFEL